MFKSVDALLDFAISEEENAAKFYTELSDKMDRQWMKKVFLDFAKEEMGHKAVLISIKKGKKLNMVSDRIMNLKILENIREDVDLSSDIDYKKALIIAMKAEKEAYILYTKLSEQTDDDNVRDLLLGLAQEEAKHKLRFEIEYDETVYNEN